MDRRGFLGKSARVAAGAAALAVGGAACSSSSSGGQSPLSTGPKRKLADEAILNMPASSSPIDHVVIVMLENRSFDHWLGWLSEDHAWLDAGKSRYGKTFAVAAKPHQTYRGANGSVSTQHWSAIAAKSSPFRGCGHPDPGHSWTDGRAERDGGFLATASGNDEFALGYYEAADLPFTAAMAQRFTVCDRSHASLLSSTFPNRMYLHSAQSGGVKTNALPTGNGYAWPTIWDRLAKAGVGARYYSTDLPVTFLWGTRYVPINKKVDDFFADCKAGTLPAVTMVDPGFIGGSRTDNHPHGDVHAGERFARDVFAAFAASPHWERGLFVLTYDEWGGFFDHVAPPTFADARASADDDNNFGQAGFRVPTVLASPYAKRGFVDSTRYDHTSILRFLEWRFLGAPAHGAGGAGGGVASWALTQRDTHANNIGSSLVARADTELGFDPALPIAAPSAACPGESEGLAWQRGQRDGSPDVQRVSTGDATAEAVPDHDFAKLITSGWLDRLGLHVHPSPMARAWVTAA